MKFAQYYDVSKIVDEMIENGEIDCYPTVEDKFCGVYVCMDTNDFWIARISKGYDENYERNEDKYLVERNKISIYDVMDKLHKQYGKTLPTFRKNDMQFEMKNKAHGYIVKFSTKDIVKAVIILDDEDGLCNWDCCETDSLEEALKLLMVDSGF